MLETATEGAPWLGPIFMFRDCIFCRGTHVSPYVEELEEMVLACRDRCHDAARRGDLCAWEGRDTIPTLPELACFQAD